MLSPLNDLDRCTHCLLCVCVRSPLFIDHINSKCTWTSCWPKPVWCYYQCSMYRIFGFVCDDSTAHTRFRTSVYIRLDMIKAIRFQYLVWMHWKAIQSRWLLATISDPYIIVSTTLDTVHVHMTILWRPSTKHIVRYFGFFFSPFLSSSAFAPNGID